MYRLRSLLPVTITIDWIHRHLRLMRKGKWQVAISCGVGVVGAILSFTDKHGSGLLSYGNYFAFLVGTAAVTILVNSITVGLLLYYFQSINDGRKYYYDRFRDSASDRKSVV